MKRLRYIVPLLLLLSCGTGCRAQTRTFFYVVTAVDASGNESAFSNEAAAQLKQGMLVGVTLKWNESSTVAGFNVYRSSTSGSGYVKINTTLVTGLTFVDPFVAPVAPSGLTWSAS